MNAGQKSTKKIVIALAALLVVIAALLGVYQFTRGHAVQGGKDITYLGELLTEEKLVSGESGPYGLFITSVDGETANDSNQEWWCITKNNEQLNTSADQTPIADGEKYELTLTVGY